MRQDKNDIKNLQNDLIKVMKNISKLITSVISGGVAGVDLHEFNIVPRGKRKAVPQTIRCLIIIKYRVKIIIPETEVFAEELDTGYHILHSMCGANVSYVVTYIDREAGFAVASRKLALEKLQKANTRRRKSKRDLVDYQPKSGTKVAYEYTVKKGLLQKRKKAFITPGNGQRIGSRLKILKMMTISFTAISIKERGILPLFLLSTIIIPLYIKVRSAAYQRKNLIQSGKSPILYAFLAKHQKRIIFIG